MYDIESKKISANEVLNFNTEGKIINDMIGIYINPIHSNSHENNNKWDNKYFVQVFNQTENKYQMKYVKNDKNEIDELKAFDNESTFDIKFGNEEETVYQIRSDKISKVDLNRADQIEDVILLSEDSESKNKHIKICSDTSKLDHNHLALGVNTSLYFADVNSNNRKIISKVENAHYNGILSLEFDPFISFNFATTGMDYSIKFWDTRNLTSPVSTVMNNSHWIWDCKYNRQFSRVMISCSSSSIVRGIIFEKEKENEEYEHESNLDHNKEHMDYTKNSVVDYVEFDDSVYSLDWALNDPWKFAAVSYNSYVYINSIPDDIKFNIMLDN